MKRLAIALIATTMVACTTAPEAIQDADQPYLGGKGAPETSPRPQPRPQRTSDRNPNCPWKHISQDCDPERDTPPPPEVECTMLWTPGTMLADNGGKKCAANRAT